MDNGIRDGTTAATQHVSNSGYDGNHCGPVQADGDLDVGPVNGIGCNS